MKADSAVADTKSKARFAFFSTPFDYFATQALGHHLGSTTDAMIHK
jgi:hypothetical protein